LTARKPSPPPRPRPAWRGKISPKWCCTAPYDWTQSTWALGRGYAARGEPKFHVVAYDYGVKFNILRMLAGAAAS
jgi:carbamoylphosphate synthase small subunit